MWLPKTRILTAVMLAACSCPAAAQDLRGVRSHGADYGVDDGYAGAFVRGAYIGAPLTRVPRPSQIVPSPWSYGTYGIPTVSGIPAAPIGQPTITVIDARGPKGSSTRSGVSGVGDRSTGARIIEVEVPRR